ncbi:hypothetical protein [Allonocardiopsis opalescens]|uniref:Uncharacterized protein n=1 Tax=Allonocardiopsis opalescens TaxID=1144618 RepID=A0A2T0Q2U7_9ACTN|nr:hypothetical protein [Allonocardiopsis opalescens]PRX98109.1 hypothetical protein CLV72_105462 [Allonocardiopsis opalescens]
MIDRRPLVPAAIAGLPYPWNVDGLSLGGPPLDSWQPNPERRATALKVLRSCLEYLMSDAPRYGGELPSLNEHFADEWISYDHTFRRRFPTLDTLSRDAIRDWLAENVDPQRLFGREWEVPPDDVVDNLGRGWVYGTVSTTTRVLIAWLLPGVRAIGTEDDPARGEDRARLLDLLKEAAPKLPGDEGVLSIGVIWSLEEIDAIGYLRMVEQHPGAPEPTRLEAKRYREEYEQELN